MLAALDHDGNPSSIHMEGRRARKIIEEARGAVAALAGSTPDNVIFTSGGTEANALALLGALHGAAADEDRILRLFVSAIEHESVRQTVLHAAETNPGLRLTNCAVTGQGQLELDSLRRLLPEGKGRALVSLMAVNNETGVIQPVADAATIARSHGALLHCDAIQAAGRIDIPDGADYLTLSAHKIGGPKGIGALIVRSGAPLLPQMRGGQQEFGRRAGTENVAAIAGFGAAAKLRAAPTTRRDALEARLKEACPEAVIFGSGVDRVANTICIAAPAISAETMTIALDLDGFAVSAGSACSSGKVAPSHVLAAMRIAPELAQCAIRVSFGWNTTDNDLTAFAEAWSRIVARASSRAAA